MQSPNVSGCTSKCNIGLKLFTYKFSNSHIYNCCITLSKAIPYIKYFVISSLQSYRQMSEKFDIFETYILRMKYFKDMEGNISEPH